MTTSTVKTISAPLSFVSIQARLAEIMNTEDALRREKEILRHARIMLRVGYPVAEVQEKITQELARIGAHG